MTVKIGINPITWTNDDMPELGGDTPLEVCLSEAAEAGYRGMEMGGKFPRTVAELRPLMQQYGLEFVSGWYSCPLLASSPADEFAAMRSHLDLLAGMGCAVMVFAEGTGATHDDRSAPASARTLVPAGDWAAYGRKVTELAERMQERGVRMAFHHHMGTPVQTADEIDRLMDATGEAVGLLLDTGHAHYAGADPVALAERYATRVVHVHCKDIRQDRLDAALERRSSFLDAVIDGVFTMPGDGAIPFAPVLERLARAGYAGWLVAEAEQDPAKAHPLTYARMGFRNLGALAAAAGFTVA